MPRRQAPACLLGKRRFPPKFLDSASALDSKQVLKETVINLMNKTIWIVVIAIIVIIIGVIIYFQYANHSTTSPAPSTNLGQTVDPLNATYLIDGQATTLVNGSSSVPAAPGSAEQVTTTIFGQPSTGDLNGDGIPDAAVILVQQSGGSGTFYYAAAAVSAATGTQGTNAILLGDRIAAQSISIQNGEIVANYADRQPNQPFSTPPSIGVTKYLKLNGFTLQDQTPTPTSTAVVTSTAPASSSSAPTVGAGAHCGGNIRNAPVCAPGYHCAGAPDSHIPFGDIGGTCVAN